MKERIINAIFIILIILVAGTIFILILNFAYNTYDSKSLSIEAQHRLLMNEEKYNYCPYCGEQLNVQQLNIRWKNESCHQ